MRIKVVLHGKEIQELVLETGRSYSGGRATESDVVLAPLKGISRNHFRIVEENEYWTIHSNSKFGEILYNGMPVNSQTLTFEQVYKIGDYELRVADDPAPMVENKPLDLSADQAPALLDPSQPPILHSSNSPALDGANALNLEPFEGSDEATVIRPAAMAIPQVRLVYPNGSEKIIQLDGKKWLAGRDESCEIQIDDAKASRRQFELNSSPQGYFIRDLGSANGTSLNGQRLEPDELKPIQSGDVINVMRVSVYFEVKDPQFEKKLMVVPKDLLHSVPSVSASPYELLAFPVVQGPGGAIRVDDAHNMSLAMRYDPRKNKKTRFYFILGILLCVLVGGYFFGDDAPNPNPSTRDEFSKLPPKKQEEVKQRYLSAKNLFAQKKFSLASEQLAKIHEILPNGIEDSLSMADQGKSAEEAEAKRAQIEEEKRRQQEILSKIEANVRECTPKVDIVSSLNEMEVCLGTAISFDPNHSLVQDLVGRVKRRMDDMQKEQQRKADYAKNVLAGKGLYSKAVGLESNLQLYEAVKAYEKHLSADYPDPDGLQAKSRAAVSRIKRTVGEDVGRYLGSARVAFQAGNYKEAMINLEKARKIDNQNNEVIDFTREVRIEKDRKMQEIYSEAVILEGLSKIQDAKEKWKQILEQDYQDDLYYQRSKSKLRQYGN